MELGLPAADQAQLLLDLRWDRLLLLDCEWDGGLGAAARGQLLRFSLSVLTVTPAGSFYKCRLNMEPGMIAAPRTCPGHAAGPQCTPGEEGASPRTDESGPSTIPTLNLGWLVTKVSGTWRLTEPAGLQTEWVPERRQAISSN